MASWPPGRRAALQGMPEWSQLAPRAAPPQSPGSALCALTKPVPSALGLGARAAAPGGAAARPFLGGASFSPPSASAPGSGGAPAKATSPPGPEPRLLLRRHRPPWPELRSRWVRGTGRRSRAPDPGRGARRGRKAPLRLAAGKGQLCARGGGELRTFPHPDQQLSAAPAGTGSWHSRSL